MKIFDTHVHIFPDKIASKASVNIGKFYDLAMEYDGSVTKELELVEENHVDKCLVQSVATTASQVTHINDFIAKAVNEHSDKFVGFCSLHPDLTKEKIEAEVDRIISLGLKGIKLHPDFQKFKIDDREAYKIYEIAEDRKLPILFHTGDFRYEYSSPSRLANVLGDFPKLIAIGAHFGGWSEWDEGERCLADKENVYVDTSSSFYSMSPEKAKEYINAFGEDRVMFGTDYPMWNLKNELEYMDKISLSDEAREKIMYKNACKLLGVEL